MKAKVYTKTGDRGETSLVDGTRVRKSAPRLETYGTIDELNSVIGLLRTTIQEKSLKLDSLLTRLESVQNNLFNVGSRLACSKENILSKLPDLNPTLVSTLESDMDAWEAALPPLKEFILPGGTTAASIAHLARTICRRAERECVRLSENEPVDSRYIIFLNRLSDWFFLAARHINAAAGVTDQVWRKDN